MYLTQLSTNIAGIHDCRHQVTSSEAVVQRLLEEDAFKQKRYNHPLGYIINMILTYFSRKVKFCNRRLPEKVSGANHCCRKYWHTVSIFARKSGSSTTIQTVIYHYCEPRTLPTVCFEDASGGSSPDLPFHRSWMRSILERTWCF